MSEPAPNEDGNTTLAAKVAFLSCVQSYPRAPKTVERRETHMSWLFLADDAVYKLKKPVHFSYLDYSTLEKREAACRAEIRLNRRLARDVYRGVTPLVRTKHGLSLDGEGEPVDWLVVMRRLDERRMLDQIIEAEAVETWHIDRLVATLTQFYRQARLVHLPAPLQLAAWNRSLADNRRVLLDARLKMPAGLVERIDGVQRRFLARRSDMLAARMRERRIVDGHGDLRPEHIFLDDPIRIIDCLEFNARLRAVDPFDEIAFLGVECERLGAAWVGETIEWRMRRELHDGPPEDLFRFYRCHRATLRARLAIAHLLEANPRTPEKWPRLARSYLDLAAADAIRLERGLRRRGGQ